MSRHTGGRGKVASPVGLTPSARSFAVVEPRFASIVRVGPFGHSRCIPLDRLALWPLKAGFPFEVHFTI